ncbi:MAG: radical SAM protein [Candidatus Cryosericum sp.]
MKFSTFSVVVGDNTCNAACPFCISKMTANEGCKDGCKEVNWQRFHIAAELAVHSGVQTMMLTGVGEPTLHPELITRYLEESAGYQLPLIELQTNGALLGALRDSLPIWEGVGLSLVCLSITHWDPAVSNRLMGIKDDTYNYWDTVDWLHSMGFSVRLNCTLLAEGINSSPHVETLIQECRIGAVEQLTLRDVTIPKNPVNQAVAKFARAQQCRDLSSCLTHYLHRNGTLMLRLPHGGTIYDYHGQNVCVNNCLTQTANPDAQRQLIFFPDGRIAYDWQHPGARIL